MIINSLDEKFSSVCSSKKNEKSLEEVNILVTFHAKEARSEFVKIFMAHRGDAGRKCCYLFTNKHAEMDHREEDANCQI